MRNKLVELIDSLLVYKIMENGRPENVRYGKNHVRLNWGNRIYLDLEMLDSDFYISVFLDNKEDSMFNDEFKELHMLFDLDQEREYNKIEKNMGYTRYKYKFEPAADVLELFIRVCGM